MRDDPLSWTKMWNKAVISGDISQSSHIQGSTGSSFLSLDKWSWMKSEENLRTLNRINFLVTLQIMKSSSIKFNIEHLYSLIYLVSSCLAAHLFFTLLPPSHAIKLNTDITALVQWSHCPSSYSQSSLCNINLTVQLSFSFANPPPLHPNLSSVLHHCKDSACCRAIGV